MWLFIGIMFAVASLPTTGIGNPRVLTLSSKVIVKGTRDSLPCRFEGTASVTFWNKISSRGQISNIAILQNGIRSGPGIDNGRFNILDDFSLVIYEVTVDDELTYICEVADRETSVLYSNSTDVAVIAYAERPTLRIPQCQNSSDPQVLYSKQTSECSVTIPASTQQDVRLDCSVVGFKPNISLYWIVTAANETVGDIQSVFSTRSDGTYELTALMRLNTSMVGNGESVSCRASGIAVNGTTEKYVTIYIIPDMMPTSKTPNKPGSPLPNGWKVGIAIIVVVLLALAVIAFILIKWKRNGRGDPTYDGVIYRMCKETEHGDPTYDGVTYRMCEQTEHDDDFKLFADDLRQYYRETFKFIKTSLFDKRTSDEIFCNVHLIRTDDTHHPCSLSMEDLLNILTDKKEIKRYVLVGKAGVGKTTLLRKIAYDWACGDCLQNIRLLFLIPLRDITKPYFFGEIPISYASDEHEISEEHLNEYIRINQDKVLVLLDGLEENTDLTKGMDESENQTTMVKVIRGEIFKRTPVVVTTRPYQQERMARGDIIQCTYSDILVEGFKQEDQISYIEQFFKEKPSLAKHLIQTLSSEASLNLVASFPIYCSMLCQLWSEETSRELIRKLQTYSQVFKEIVHSLREHYQSKSHTDASNLYKICEGYVLQVGEVALKGVLSNKTVLQENDFDPDTLSEAYKIGLLSKSTKVAPREIRRTEGKQYVTEVHFPHDLFQMFLSGRFLAHLHQNDKPRLANIIEEQLVTHYREFRYLFYFAGSQDKEIAQSIMETLIAKVHNENFLLDVAFECFHESAIDLVVKYLENKTSATLTNDIMRLDEHTQAAFLHVWKHFGFEVIEDDAVAAVIAGYSQLPKLETLKLQIGLGNILSKSVYEAIALVAPKTKVKILHHEVVFDPDNLHEASRRPSALHGEELGKAFFESIEGMESSPMRFLTTRNEDLETSTEQQKALNAKASKCYGKAIFSMPNLTSVKLDGLMPAPTFFEVMAELSLHSQITQWTHLSGGTIDPQGSEHYSRGLLAMPELHTLTLDGMSLDMVFFKLLRGRPVSNITSLSISRFEINACQLGSLLSLPSLVSISLHRIKFLADKEGALEVDNVRSTITELDVDNFCLTSLHEILPSLPLHKMCPTVSCIILANIHFRPRTVQTCKTFEHLTKVRVQWTHSCNMSACASPAKFCKELTSSCRKLESVSFVDVELKNSLTTELIGCFQYSSLKHVGFSRCKTDKQINLTRYANMKDILHISPGQPSWESCEELD